MSILETIALSGGESYDPDGNKGGDTVTYLWEVLNEDSSAVISRTTKQRVLLPSTQDISLAGKLGFQITGITFIYIVLF